MNRAIDRFKTGCVQIGFIKTYWLKERRKISQDSHKFLGGITVFRKAAFDKGSLGAKAAGSAEGHTGV
ncbi:hypothetical protein ES705_40558 [subsurface metagenome]